VAYNLPVCRHCGKAPLVTPTMRAGCGNVNCPGPRKGMDFEVWITKNQSQEGEKPKP
jgi:hypothetical protein